MPRYEARRTLQASVEDVWALLAEPARWPEWWPGLVGAEPTVRRALAPGAHWQLEGTERPQKSHKNLPGPKQRQIRFARPVI